MSDRPTDPPAIPPAPYWKPTLELFQELDRKTSKEECFVVRFHALEWLRLECVKRLRLTLTAEEQSIHEDDLRMVDAQNYHWLIGHGDRPVGWLFPYLDPELTRTFPLRTLKVGQTWSDPRLHGVVYNPEIQTADLVRAFRRQVVADRAAVQRQRAHRQREYSLARLWEVLDLHDRYAGSNVSLKDIGIAVTTLPNIKSPSDTIYSKRGDDVKTIAAKMFETARQPPREWIATFL
jgi:hypothetical protein